MGAWPLESDRDPGGDKLKIDEVLASDTLLLGRRTYAIFTDARTSRTDVFADK
ncbi:MAG: hypothetical protein ACRDQ2_19065 [Gaiellales bacterium]